MGGVGCCPACGQEIDVSAVGFDAYTGRVTLGGETVRLERLKAMIFGELLRAYPATRSSNDLAFALWGGQDEPEDARGNICVHILRMRKILAPLGVGIETIRGVGRRLTLPTGATVLRKPKRAA